jgi:hypothetical protein
MCSYSMAIRCLKPAPLLRCYVVTSDSCLSLYLFIVSLFNDAKSVSEVSDHILDDRVISPAAAKTFPLAPVSRPALRPTQPPMIWILGSFPG